MLALLAGRFGDLDLADESVQEALVQAVETWPGSGVPRNPPAWLHTVARNRAIDRLRRDAAARRRLADAAPELAGAGDRAGEQEGAPIVEHVEVGDEQLRLVLLCCHPALERDSQVALTLRLVGGLTTAEIAAAYLVPEPTIAQRIVRAKRKIRAANIPLTIPAALDSRIAVVLRVLSLIFNEGYLSRGDAGAPLIRTALADEAIRLTRAATRLLPDDAEVAGLLALELYHRARWATRTDGDGGLVLLAEQDRGAWDRSMIAAADETLRGALDRDRPGPFQVQALIASVHANSPSSADTDWAMLVALYGRLMALEPNPVVALNRAVAVAHAEGAAAGLALLEVIPGLDGYHLLHATRAELLLRIGDHVTAAAEFRTALRLATSAAERRHLAARLEVALDATD